MKKLSTIYFSRTLAVLLTTCLPLFIYGQLDADLNSTDNTNCFGAPCNYSGPSILINELMMSPNDNDGSLWGGLETQRGEWIELYNPNICEEIDISCYYLGNNANDNSPYPGGYVIPPGTVVPPAGFALIRGVNAAAVPAARLIENGGNVIELVVSGDGVCVGGGSRLWFPNSGGWFAFYDANGVPQDAVSWATQSNTGNYPCTPTLAGCGFSGTLPNYNEFPNDRKNYILNTSAADFKGQSIRRLPDGGTWSGPGTPTYANCNAACVDADFINCNGTATASPTGGTPPYSYLWNDPQSQTTQIADQLCAGQYCVLITDGLGNTVEQCIDVEDVVYEIEISAGICDGESYTLPDNSVVSAAGEYPVMLYTGSGCDSLVTVNLEVYPNYDFELNPQICPSDTYTLPDGAEVSTSGTYNFSYQTIQGCDSLYTVNLTVASPIQIAVNAQICEGNTYQLPDGTDVGGEGEYQILVDGDPASCDTLYTINLAFYPDFQIEADALNHISCYGEQDGSIHLNVNGVSSPYNYAWSDGMDHGAEADSLGLGLYTVEVTDENGCKADTVFEISEPTPVSLTASADELICFGSESGLTAVASGGTGDFTYHWTHTSSNASSSQVSPVADTIYAVFARDVNGCTTDTINLQVAVISMYADSLDVSASDSLCFGSSATVSAAYSGQYPPYLYSWSNGLADGPGPHSVSPDTTTNYTITVSDNCGNTVSKEIPVIIWSLPIAALDSIAHITCFGEMNGYAEISVTEGTPAYAYTWSDGEDHGAIGEALMPATYNVDIADANGCETAISFAISEPTPIELTLTGDTLICFGAEATLIAAATGGTGAKNYEWSHTASVAASTNVSPEQDTVYTVYAQDNNGCESEELEWSVAVMSMDAGLLNVSNDTAICPGDVASFSGFYSGNYPPYAYNWTGGLETGQGPHVVSPSETTIFELTVSDVCNNSLTANIEVGLYENPIVNLPDDLLAGCSPLEINLMDSINTASGYSHEWMITNSESLAGNPLNLVLTDPDIYEVSLIVTSPEGCSASSENSIPVEVYALPVANFNASPWTTSIENPEITFTDISSGSVFSRWTIDDIHIENQMQTSYTYSDTGRYAVQLYVENEFGCRDSITKWITIEIDHSVEIPNAFTPSDPGDNPYYDPNGTSNTVFYPFSEYVSDYQLSIFNRWGELIFESTEFEMGWNGTYRDEPCPQDVYVYKVEFMFTDGKKRTEVGDVTLFR